MRTSRVAQLSELIATNVAKLEEYWKSHNLLFPSFDVDGPVDMNLSTDAPETEAARITAIEASIELQDLLQGPIISLRPIVSTLSTSTIMERFGLNCQFFHLSIR